jgi:glycosyltransferase involved in cell wall biosynthesis
MKVLVLYEYPPSPGGLSTQGDYLYRGLQEIGVDVYPVHAESAKEKEWYYRWFKPDIAVGIGYWGHTPDLILHPQHYGIRAVPWLVADGFIANYQDVLNALPLILVTSNWVKEMYVRDGIAGGNIEVLPVGCDTDLFSPHDKNNERVNAIREEFEVSPEELMLLTIGGDAASKGAREVMEALALVDKNVPPWKYVCKVWPQRRTDIQNVADLKLAKQLGLKKKIVYATSIASREYTSNLINACDIYTAPSRLEGFGMPQVEAGACEKPVISINAMGMLDTIVQGKTGLLADVAQRIVRNEVVLGAESGYKKKHTVIFDPPRTVDYRASVPDIATYLEDLMNNPEKRKTMGQAARKHVVEKFDYRQVARQFVQIITEKFEID